MKKLIFIIATPLILIGAIFSYNYFTLQNPLNKELKTDDRNQGINICVHYKYYILTNELVYDIKSIKEDKAPLDMFRVFLTSAKCFKEKTFNTVELASRGNPKFYITGEYYKLLGTEFEVQNPIYTLRTFPENVYLLDGTKAYEEWSGGLFAVLKNQMEDVMDLNKKWYVDDMSK